MIYFQYILHLEDIFLAFVCIIIYVIKNILLIKNVCKVINKKRKTAGGYIWRLKSENLSEKELMEIKNSKESQKNKIILQLDLGGNLIKEWNSVNEVKKIYKHINAVLSNKRKTAGGFKWMYKSN